MVNALHSELQCHECEWELHSHIKFGEFELELNCHNPKIQFSINLFLKILNFIFEKK